MPLVDADQRREALLALVPHLGAEATRTLDELLPTRPWREVLTAEFWYREDVMKSVDVRAMRQLHEAFIEQVGPRHAATLMEFLPPVPWRVLWSHGISRADFDAPA